MIIEDPTREVPTEWTDNDLVDLFDHARWLGNHGNPGGYLLTVALFPFVGTDDQEQRILLPRNTWDYDGMRQWVKDNPDHVRITWQRMVASP